MTDRPINLNRMRKARARDESRRQADANAVKFGRARAERTLEAARSDKAVRTLDEHQIDPEAE